MDQQDWRNNYYIHQINGTIYVSSNLILAPEHVSLLQCGAGELFLGRISRRTKIDEIMQVAVQLGEVFMLRFKIDFSGFARGYAYLQYIDVNNMQRALDNLQHLFRVAGLKIQVRQSKNLRKLFLINVDHMEPLQVYEHLRFIWRYVKLTVFEYDPYKYAYIIEYRNNDEAAIAHNLLKTKHNNFGSKAIVTWLEKIQGSPKTPIISHQKCCVPVPSYGVYYPCFVYQMQPQPDLSGATYGTLGYVQNTL